MDRSHIKMRAGSMGLSMITLAEELGITRSGFYKMISKETMSVSTYKKMCGLLNVPIGTFISHPAPHDINNRLANMSTELDEIKKSLKQLTDPKARKSD